MKKRKEYDCGFCLKSFGGSSLLTIHLKTHKGPNPFECPDCIRNFSHKEAFESHFNKHHSKNSEAKDYVKCQRFIEPIRQEYLLENTTNCLPIIKEEMVVVKLEEIDEEKPDLLGVSEIVSKLKKESSGQLSEDFDLGYCNSICIKHEPI